MASLLQLSQNLFSMLPNKWFINKNVKNGQLFLSVGKLIILEKSAIISVTRALQNISLNGKWQVITEIIPTYHTRDILQVPRKVNSIYRCF